MFLLDRMLRRAIHAGTLTVIDHSGRRRIYGVADPARRSVTIRLRDAATAWRIGINPALGAGEAWTDGRLTVEDGDLLDLLDLVGYNMRWDGENRTRTDLWKGQAFAAWLDQHNYARRARRNVAHHYDLSDRLYDLFLDADRQYSCAYFTDPGNSFEEAQSDKKAHIAAKLALAPGMRVLDIGCGWGGLALYLNRVAGVDVTGVTLSEEQLRGARRRAEEAGVSDQVRFELLDYRGVRAHSTAPSRSGMFEHVGTPYYRQFFASSPGY
jgi:cyclopropane-fatty-acyl-phospholipid synthase